MNKSPNKNNLMRRRLLYVFLTLVVLIAGSVFGWDYLAEKLESGLNKQVKKLAIQGKTLKCDNQRIEGFPFRVGLFCDEIFFEEPSKGIMFKAGKVRSAAQFYQPGFMVGEVDSPAQLSLPNTGGIDLQWKLAQTSSRISLAGVKRVSLNLENLVARKTNNNPQRIPDVYLSSLGLHIRAAGDDIASADAEIAIDLKSIQIKNLSEQLFPTTHFSADGVISGMNQTLKKGEDIEKWIREKGLKIQLHKLEFALADGGTFSASGPVRVNQSGLVSGKLDVKVVGIDNLVRILANHIPKLDENAKLIQAASMLFSQGAKNKTLRLQLDIRNGNISAGFIQLGVIPPLF
jgi:hypothetical protein